MSDLNAEIWMAHYCAYGLKSMIHQFAVHVFCGGLTSDWCLWSLK